MTIRAHCSRLDLVAPDWVGHFVVRGLSAVHAQTTEPTATTTPSTSRGRFARQANDAVVHPRRRRGCANRPADQSDPAMRFTCAKPGDPGYEQQQINQTMQTVAPPPPSNRPARSIVGAPFGSSVPYYGGITSGTGGTAPPAAVAARPTSAASASAPSP